MTRSLTAPDAEKPPTFTAQLGATGGMRADREAVIGTGQVNGQLTAQRGGFTGCVSGDGTIAARDKSAHITASGSIPLFITALSMGFSLDHDVELALATPPEYLLARANRVAGQFSIAFVDFEMSQWQDHLRVMVVPFTVEQGVDHQTTTMLERRRYTTAIDTSLFRFAPRNDAGAYGKFDLFALQTDWIDVANATEEGATGFVKFSPVSLEHRGIEWSFTADGGVLSLAGPVDCEKNDCTTGFYRFAFGHAWEKFSVEGRAERSAFIGTDNAPAIDDRLSASATFTQTERSIGATAFGALTKPWLGNVDSGRTAGVRVVGTQSLGRGFSAVVDAELARTYYGTRDEAEMTAPSPGIENVARVMVSLGWQFAMQK